MCSCYKIDKSQSLIKKSTTLEFNSIFVTILKK